MKFLGIEFDKSPVPCVFLEKVSISAKGIRSICGRPKRIQPLDNMVFWSQDLLVPVVELSRSGLSQPFRDIEEQRNGGQHGENYVHFCVDWFDQKSGGHDHQDYDDSHWNSRVERYFVRDVQDGLGLLRINLLASR